MANNVTDLGKVGITLKGEWNSSTSYERLDTVTYEGSLYIAVRDNVGSQPSESNTNWMLGAKHGEFTEQQLEDFKAEVVAESKEEMDDYTDDKKTELDTYTGAKKAELDTYEGTKEAELNTYASGLKDDFDANATSKTTAFNTNATNKTTAFDSNAVAKTTAFDTNASTKTSAFNGNATAKTTAFDENAEEKTGDFNDNVDEKTAEFDTHVEEKEAEFDENVDNIQEQITDIQEFIDSELEQGITEKSTRADVSDSAKWYGELTPEGRTEQKQLQGYNLFDYTQVNNLAFGTKQDASGNYILQNKKYRGNYIQVDPNVTYIISRKNTTDFSRFRVCCTEVLPVANVRVISESIVNGDELTDLSITIPENGHYLFLYLSNSDEDITPEMEVQITKSEELLPYEPYVGGQASPSPDYPQEIRNVEGRSCRNLFNKDTTTTGYRIVWATGESYAEPTAEISDFIEIKGDTYYILTNKCYIIAYDDAKQYLGSLTNTGIAKSNGITTSNFKLSNDVKYVKLLKYGGVNNFIGFQMNEGNTLLPYEPYFEGKRLEFNVCNRNLLNPTEFASKVVNSPYNSNNTSVYNSETGELNIMMGNNSVVYDNFKEDTRYTIILATSDDTSGQLNLKVIYTDGTSANLSKTNAGLFVTDANKSVMKIIHTAGNSSGVRVIKLFESGIFEGALTASDFIQHKQQLIQFPLADGQKLMEGDYLADDGVHHVRGKSILPNASKFNAITLDGVAGQYVVYSLPNGKPQGSAASNNFISNKLSYNYNRIKKYTAYTIARSLVVLTDADDTLENFNSNIRGSIVEYNLAEETIEPYTPAQAEAYNELKKILLNQGVNHIWCDTDGLEPNLQLTYYKSNKERLNNIEARLELLEE